MEVTVSVETWPEPPAPDAPVLKGTGTEVLKDGGTTAEDERTTEGEEAGTECVETATEGVETAAEEDEGVTTAEDEDAAGVGIIQTDETLTECEEEL